VLLLKKEAAGKGGRMLRVLTPIVLALVDGKKHIIAVLVPARVLKKGGLRKVSRKYPVLMAGLVPRRCLRVLSAAATSYVKSPPSGAVITISAVAEPALLRRICPHKMSFSPTLKSVFNVVSEEV
jgi:hypothetical protein